MILRVWEPRQGNKPSPAFENARTPQGKHCLGNEGQFGFGLEINSQLRFGFDEVRKAYLPVKNGYMFKPNSNSRSNQTWFERQNSTVNPGVIQIRIHWQMGTCIDIPPALWATGGFGLASQELSTTPLFFIFASCCRFGVPPGSDLLDFGSMLAPILQDLGTILRGFLKHYFMLKVNHLTTQPPPALAPAHTARARSFRSFETEWSW